MHKYTIVYYARFGDTCLSATTVTSGNASEAIGDFKRFHPHAQIISILNERGTNVYNYAILLGHKE